MPRIVPISRAEFGDKAWLRSNDYSFAASQPIVPIVAAEFAKVASLMPIAFVLEGGHHIPVALLSPVPGCNLFVGPTGQWLGAYPPASLRVHPFALRRSDSEQLMLCIDAESSRVVPASDPSGIKFFDPDGTPAASTKALLGFWQQFESNRALTDAAIAVLVKMELIEPWPFQITVDGDPRQLEGLFRVAEARLAALNDEGFLELRRAGALPLAYMQLWSMTQVGVFDQLSRMQGQTAAAPAPQTVAEMEELFAFIDPEGKLFG